METILNADGKKTLWLPHEEVHSCWEPVYNYIKNQFSNFQMTISVRLFMTKFYTLCTFTFRRVIMYLLCQGFCNEALMTANRNSDFFNYKFLKKTFSCQLFCFS